MKSNYFWLFVIYLLSCLHTNALGEPGIKVVNNNSAKTLIVKGQNSSLQELNIIRLLQQKIQEKTGITIPITEEQRFSISDSEYNTIILPGRANSNSLLKEIMDKANIIFPNQEESYKLITENYHSMNVIIIAGADELGILYGIGKLLRTADYSKKGMIVSSLNMNDAPVDGSRGIYYAIHCNNWYEDIPEIEKVKDLISEQGLWGANILWMWFDMSMYRKSPFEENSDSRNKWERIKQLAKAANDIGMKVGLVEIANAAYLDQVRDKLKAIGGEPPEGLLCPYANNGEAMHIMDHNYRNLYEDLKIDNITVHVVSLAFYDRGGCHCNLCRPWVKTGIKFIGEFHANTINEYFPQCEIYINDWHFEKTDGVDEVEWTKSYLKSSGSDWVHGIHRDDRHAWDRWAGIDQNFEVITFFDISMIGGWSGFGANPFPKRLDIFFSNMRANGINGGMAYTEGLFDDINKVLVLQHHWGEYSSESILKEYAKWYFNADKKAQQTIAGILFDMESEWSDIYSNWNHHLTTNPQLKIKNRVEKLEGSLSENIKAMWRWKLIHSRANIAQIATEISGLKGSGFDQFVVKINGLSPEKASKMIREKEICLNQRIQQFDDEYDELYYGVFDGTKSGMYGGIAPDPARWINGFNKGEKWREIFKQYPHL